MDWLILMGVITSMGMGEGKYSPSLEVRARSEHFELAGRFDLSSKVESRMGWIGSIRSTYTISFLRLGMAAIHRDGGLWTKNSLWGEVGVGIWKGAIDGRIALLGDTNKELGVRVRIPIGNHLEWEGQILSHSTGIGKTTSLSFTF